jgi:hypothetical protein
MEEEKKKRKLKEVEINSLESEEKESPIIPSKKETKKAYTVVLVTMANVIFRVSENSNSVTPNIWGDKLKPGDQIYL